MPRRVARSLLFIVTLLTAPRAFAGGWQEVHQSSDDVRLSVGPDGVAAVEHHLRYRIVAGRFKSLDLTGIDPRAELVTETVIAPEKGVEIAAHLEPNAKTPGALTISFDASKAPKGLTRGSYVLTVKYKLDLVATRALAKDGAMWRLAWTAPAAPEGYDGARVVFELPPAPTEPRLASPEQAQTTIATLRRQSDKDELELVRAHVPRGEAVVWSARVDPKAFLRVASPELASPSTIGPAEPETSDAHVALVVAALATIAGALAFALRAKEAAVAAGAEARAAKARPLLPVKGGLRPYAYGATGAGALAALLWGTPLHGAILAVLAMALATHFPPRRIAKPRGPGRFQRVADEAVLVARHPARAAGDALDMGTRTGRVTAALVALVTFGAAFLLRPYVPGAAIAIPLAAAVLVPLWTTGTRAQLPCSPEEQAARFLRPARDALGALVDLSHVELQCVARLREGTREADEIRLACAPAERLPGLRALELAVAFGSVAAMPEVLVRYDDGSPAAAKIAQLAPGVPVVLGRSPEEKVLRLRPPAPTPMAAARLLARLLADLEERRGEPPVRRRYEGPERRIALAALRAAPVPC